MKKSRTLYEMVNQEPKTLEELKAEANSMRENQEALRQMINKGEVAKQAAAKGLKQRVEKEREIAKITSKHEMSAINAAYSLLKYIELKGENRLKIYLEVRNDEYMEVFNESNPDIKHGTNGARICIDPFDMPKWGDDTDNLVQQLLDTFSSLCTGRHRAVGAQIYRLQHGDMNQKISTNNFFEKIDKVEQLEEVEEPKEEAQNPEDLA